MDMQHGDMNMQHGHGHRAWTWICSMELDMQHGHGYAVRIWTCSEDMGIHMRMDMDFYWTGGLGRPYAET